MSEAFINIQAPEGVIVDRRQGSGAVVRVPKGLVVKDPIEIVYRTPGNDSNARLLRTEILLEEGAEAKVVEHFLGEGTETKSTTTISLATGSLLDHFRFQEEGNQSVHVGNVQVRQGRSSRFRSYVYNLGGGKTRSEVGTVLEEEGAECELQGLYAAGGSQQVDNQTLIDHATPHGTSSELYKGILSGSSQGIFNGKIIVRKDAQKTSARQMNKNLLLSKDAVVSSQPFLEILANDVKCNHGTTIGRLDEQALFYLRSRGIEEDKARALLTQAFAVEIIQCVPWAVWRSKIEAALVRRLGSPSSQMEAA